MTPGARRILAALAAALIGASAPLGAAAPALAQSSPRQTLNVQGADIRAFIQDIARTTGHTFIVDPRVTGTVTVTSERALSRAELFEVFLSTLRANGLVVSPTASGAYRVSPAEGAAQGPATVGSERFATEVFQIANIDAASAAEVIRPLVGAQGQVLVNPRGNTLVVADFADNLRRIRGLIREIDVDRSAYEVITLRNSSAREIARVVNEVLAPPGGGAPGMVSVVAVESSNSIILRGDPAAVARIRPLVDDLDRRAESADDVRVVFLEHADAEQLLPVLQQMTGQISRPLDGVQSASADSEPSAAPGARANIARFPGANALVIAAAPETQRMLSEVIRQLDTRRRQVLVEAIVVEVSDDAARALGVQWALAGRDGNPLFATNYSNTSPRILPILGAVAGERELDDDDPLLEDLRGAALNSLLGANGVLGMGGGRIGSDGLFGAIINAVRSDEGSNLLSTPSLMTLDNEEATILVGQEVPVVVGEVLGSNNTNPFRTTQRQDIGVKLEVRPQINAGGAITLFLRQEVSSINGVLTAGASDLVLNKREIQTTVLVDDGQIAVLGGLLDQNERLSVESVPGLGDIPVIGNLFRSTARQRGQTNLMIFIRPTIIRGPADASRVSADRWDYMRRQQIARDPAVEPTLDALIRDYMGGYRPAAPVAGGDVISPAGMTPAPVEGAPLPPHPSSPGG